jgi:hypothetical protein
MWGKQKEGRRKGGRWRGRGGGRERGREERRKIAALLPTNSLASLMESGGLRHKLKLY